MHYKIINEKKLISGESYAHRIELIIDCVHGTIGTKGGYISNYTNLIDDAWVADGAIVSGQAQVSGKAVVSGNARVNEKVRISGSSKVSGNAQISGSSEIRDKAVVTDNCIVKDKAQVYGTTILKDDCVAWGEARIHGGEWIESPFQAWGSNKFFVTECEPNHLHIGCETKTFEKWITDGYSYAKKKDNADHYDKYAGFIEPLIRKYLAYSKANWSELGIVQKATYAAILIKSKAWLARNNKEDDTKQYDIDE